MKHKIVRFFYYYAAVRSVWRIPFLRYHFQFAPGFGLTYAIASSKLHLEVLAQLFDHGMTVLGIGANRVLISLMPAVESSHQRAS